MAAQPGYSARRSPVFARHGMVAATQPLAVDAGLSILKAGGNAIDAAIATAAAMAVCEPCSTGLGGDAFVLYYDAATRSVSGLNGSGRSPDALTLERALASFAEATPSGGPAEYASEFPPLHAHAITVPGAAAAWCDALAKWGTMDMPTVLAPAIAIAREGFPVSPITAANWAGGVRILRHHPTSSSSELLVTDAAGGLRAPKPGEVFTNPFMARTLETLAAGGKESFYSGPIGSAIVAAVTAAGGSMTMADLVSHESTYPAPISVDYHGVRVWEIPPNGQGLTALLALGTLQAMHNAAATTGTAPAETVAAAAGSGTSACCRMRDFAAAAAEAGEATAAPRPSHAYCGPLKLPTRGPSTLADAGPVATAASLHPLIEAVRLAFADTRAYVADPDVVRVPTAGLLAPAYAQSRAALVHAFNATVDCKAGSPAAGTDTISFQVVDAAGNAVSFINSNYMGFGSGLVPRGCGFSLQNRGAGFSLETSHPNVLAPRKRPYHTIIPGLATVAETGDLFATFSNMGGFMQPQGHVQLLVAMLDYGVDPQTAIDLPRFCISDGTAGGGISLEEGIHAEEAAKLISRGHHVTASGVSGYARSMFGRAQIIYRDPVSGVLWGGSDGRGDGCAMGY